MGNTSYSASATCSLLYSTDLAAQPSLSNGHAPTLPTCCCIQCLRAADRCARVLKGAHKSLNSVFALHLHA
jgi:hypothetical protein